MERDRQDIRTIYLINQWFTKHQKLTWQEFDKLVLEAGRD